MIFDASARGYSKDHWTNGEKTARWTGTRTHPVTEKISLIPWIVILCFCCQWLEEQ